MSCDTPSLCVCVCIMGMCSHTLLDAWSQMSPYIVTWPSNPRTHLTLTDWRDSVCNLCLGPHQCFAHTNIPFSVTTQVTNHSSCWQTAIFPNFRLTVSTYFDLAWIKQTNKMSSLSIFQMKTQGGFSPHLSLKGDISMYQMQTVVCSVVMEHNSGYLTTMLYTHANCVIQHKHSHPIFTHTQKKTRRLSLLHRCVLLP